MHSSVTGAILAGGQATRYGGRPKGLERVGGIRIIDRVADALRVVTPTLLLIANASDAAAWLPGVPVATDIRTGLGSLGGIHAALKHADGPALIVACDMPFVPPALLAELCAVAGNGRADVVVPESDSRRGVEPLCAWYAPACVAAIERSLDADDRRVVGFYDAVRVVTVPLATVRRFGDPDRMFSNVNTPADRDAADRAPAPTTE